MVMGSAAMTCWKGDLTHCSARWIGEPSDITDSEGDEMVLMRTTKQKESMTHGSSHRGRLRDFMIDDEDPLGSALLACFYEFLRTTSPVCDPTSWGRYHVEEGDLIAAGEFPAGICHDCVNAAARRVSSAGISTPERS